MRRKKVWPSCLFFLNFENLVMCFGLEVLLSNILVEDDKSAHISTSSSGPGRRYLRSVRFASPMRTILPSPHYFEEEKFRSVPLVALLGEATYER